MKLLFVCLGNICRSPMAEGAMRAQIAASGLAGRVEVDSAGTAGWHAGRPPDQRAIECAARHGVDIAGLRARQLQEADFLRFDRILCADADNLRATAERCAAPVPTPGQLAMWLPWAGIEYMKSIPDPYYGGPEDFEQTWALVEEAARLSVRRLVRAAESGIIGA